MKKCLWYTEISNKKVKCSLCPHNCIINPDEVGICEARINETGTLYSRTYGKPCSMTVDPIEKKPLYHFFPNGKIFSLGTFGCNLNCMFCQNWELSTTINDDITSVTPERVITECATTGADMIAFTYNEPTIYYEYMLDIAKLAKKKKWKTVVVSNGFINEKPLKELCKYIDAFNIDLKSFDNMFYKKFCEAQLEPVLNSIRIIKEEECWIELTNLIIPGENDDMKKIEEMCKWIASYIGDDVPLHFSKFTPMHKMQDHDPTPIETLLKAKEVAKKYLKYIYIGNVQVKDGAVTYCPKCNEKLIERTWIGCSNKIKEGKCPKCKEKIDGVWE